MNPKVRITAPIGGDNLPKIALLAVVYFVAAKVGLSFAIVGANVTLVWPSSGIALAALLLFGDDLWPGIALGSLVANATTGVPLIASIAIAVGSTVSALAASYFLRRFVDFHLDMARVRDVLGLFFWGAFASTSIAAIIGSLTLALAGTLTGQALVAASFVWWLGDGLGVLIVTPLVLSWRKFPKIVLPSQAALETGVMAGAVVVLCWALYANKPTNGIAVPLSYLLFPLVMWAALRFGQRGAISVSLVALGFGIWGTTRWTGPFVRDSLLLSYVSLYSYMGIVALTGMLLAAALEQYRQAETRLRLQNDSLTTMHEIGVNLSAQLDLPLLLKSIVTRGADLLNAWLGGLFLMLPDGETLEAVISHPATQGIVGRRMRFGEGVVGMVAQTGKNLYIADYQAWPEHLKINEGKPYGSVVGVPIKWQGEVLGVMTLVGDKIDQFSPEDLEIVRLLADQAAVAIVNARLYADAQEEIEVRKRAEEKLREAEERFSKAFHSNPSAIAINKFENSIFLDVNDTFLAMFEYSREEVIGRTPKELGMWDKATRDQVIAVTSARKPIRTLELKVYPKSGEARESLISTEIIELHGETYVLTMLQDITEQKRMQAAEHQQRVLAEALRDTAALLNSTLHLAAVLDRILTQVAAVVPHDAATILAVNGDMVEVLRHRGHVERGIDKAQLEATKFNVADAPLIQTQIRTGKPIAIPDVSLFPDWRYFNEESHWIRAYVGAPILFQGELLGLINLDGGRPGMFDEQHAERLEAFANQAAIALQNARHAEELEQRVTARTAELDSQRKQLQILLDATAEGIMYTEVGVIRYVNSALLKITGYDPADLIGQRVSILWQQTSDPQNRQKLESVRDIVVQGEVWRGEVKLMRKDGMEFDAALTVSQVGEIGEEPVRFITLVRDISKEKELEAQKARFIANAAHELSSPISSLSLRLSLMQRYPDRMEEHLTMLDGITQRMKRLVEDLLDISRFEHGKISLHKQPVVVQNLVGDVVKMYRPEADSKHLHLQYEPSSLPIRVSADPERLTQVLTNLITNAIQYTPEGGYIQVTTTVEGNGVPQSRLAVVAVRDTGKGIPADDLPYIFQPFYRVDDSRKGMGLGLSISKEIVDMHGGQISVESEFGSGSSFYIRLPVADEY